MSQIIKLINDMLIVIFWKRKNSSMLLLLTEVTVIMYQKNASDFVLSVYTNKARTVLAITEI